ENSESHRRRVPRRNRFPGDEGTGILRVPLPPQMITPILLNILGPILLMVGFGALLRWRLALDLTTLGKLNIYLFTPAFIFKHVSESKLAWSDMGGIVLITVVQVFTLGMLIWGIGRALR